MNLRLAAIVAVALGAGFAAGAWWMQARLAPELAALERAAGESLIGDLAKLSGAVPGPQLPDASTAGATAPPALAPAPTAVADARPASGKPVSPKELPPELAELIGRLTAMDRDFEAQKRDDAWATKQDKALRDLLRNSPALLPPGVELVAIDCRTTLCQVRFTGAPKDYRGAAEDPMRTFSETLSAHRYGVHWSIVGRPDAPVDDYLFLLRPEALFAQPSVGQP